MFYEKYEKILLEITKQERNNEDLEEITIHFSEDFSSVANFEKCTLQFLTSEMSKEEYIDALDNIILASKRCDEIAETYICSFIFTIHLEDYRDLFEKSVKLKSELDGIYSEEG